MPFYYNTDIIEKYRMNELMDAIDHFESDFFDHLDSMNLTYQQNYLCILIDTFGKTILTAREVLTLSANGYADGALSLSRNLFEQMMIIAYFQEHLNDDRFEDDVKAYFADYTRKRNNALISYYRDCGLADIEISKLEAEKKELESEIARKMKNDYWWTEYNSFSVLVSSFINKENDPDFKRLYSTLFLTYKRACISIHANSMGNAIRLGSDSSFWNVYTGPLTNGHGCPLWLSTFCITYIVGVLCTTFSIDYTPYKEVFNDLVQFYNGKFRSECMQITDQIPQDYS